MYTTSVTRDSGWLGTRAAHLAELETAAWKDDRRFRLLSLDGGDLAFVDLSFHTPSRPRAGPPAEPVPGTAANFSITGAAAAAFDPYLMGFRGGGIAVVSQTVCLLSCCSLCTVPPPDPAPALPQTLSRVQQCSRCSDSPMSYLTMPVPPGQTDVSGVR